MIFIYYVFNILLYGGGVLEILAKDKLQKQLLYLITFFMFLFFAGLKEGGGTDFNSYENMFFTITYENITGGFIEPVFAAFIYIVKVLGGGFGLFYFLVACFNLSIKFYVFRKLTPYLLPALLIYFVGLFFERDNDGIRQGLSIAFCYLSLPALLEHRNRVFLFYNVIAVLIHYSSFVFIFIWLIQKIRWSDKWVAGIVICCISFPLLKLSVIDTLLYIIPFDNILIKLMAYTEAESYSAALGINIGLLFRILIFLFFIRYHESLKISDSLYYLLRNGFAFAIIMSLLFYDFAILAHRLPYAFREFQIFIIPYFFTIADKKNKLFLLSVVFTYSLVILSRFLYGDNFEVYNSYSNRILDFFI